MKAASASLRSEFPILRSKTYLASHSLGAVPRSTLDALKEFHFAWASMGIQAWEGPWWEEVQGFCARVERIINAASGSVVPLPNATRGMAAIASTIDWRGRKNKVVMTDLEFTTFYPFWKALEGYGARIEIVPSPDGVTIDADDIVAAVDPKTALVATCHAYFRSGAVQDLKRVVEGAHEKGAWVLGDGYQAVGTYPVDVRGLDIDFYVAGSHKYLCGGAGAGFLYVRPDLQDRLTPRLTGWFGLDEPFSYKQVTREHRLNPGVFKFLDGTIAIPALFAAREGLRMIERVSIPHIRSHSLRMTRQIMDGAHERGLRVKTPEDEWRSGMVCIDFPGADKVVERLVGQGVVVDHRPDCGLRASPHFYNSKEDVAAFFDALDAARKRGRPRGANGARPASS